MPRLTPAQVQQKLQEGRNYKHLYIELKLRFDEVLTQHKQCPKLLAEQQAAIATLQIQIAELQTMVFGKKKRPPMGGTPIGSELSSSGKAPRTKDSYRRPLPPASAVTLEAAVPLPAACACGGSFDPAKTTMHARYEEDIPLPELTPNYQAHLVTKYAISRGICLACGKAVTTH